MKNKPIHLIALFLLMLVTGIFWGTWFTLTRSLDEFSGAEFIHIGRVIIGNVAVPMRIIFPACVLLMIVALWRYPVKRSAGYYWGWAALVLIVITLAITLAILVPIDNRIKEWTASTLPVGWEDLRHRWDSFHAWRTMTSLASFACFSVSIIYQKIKKW